MLAVIVLDVPVSVSFMVAGVAEALTENVSGWGPSSGVTLRGAGETVTPVGSPLT
jgi:hypothetical protein